MWTSERLAFKGKCERCMLLQRFVQCVRICVCCAWISRQYQNRLVVLFWACICERVSNISFTMCVCDAFHEGEKKTTEPKSNCSRSLSLVAARLISNSLLTLTLWHLPCSIRAAVSVRTQPPCASRSWWWTRRPLSGRRPSHSLQDWTARSEARYIGSTACKHTHTHTGTRNTDQNTENIKQSNRHTMD